MAESDGIEAADATVETVARYEKQIRIGEGAFGIVCKLLACCVAQSACHFSFYEDSYCICHAYGNANDCFKG